MLYSFHCKTCGFTGNYLTKEERLEARLNHKLLVNGITKTRTCPMVRFRGNIQTRPELEEVGKLRRAQEDAKRN